VRSLAIIATAAVIGPPVGSIVVLLLTVVAIGVREGSVFAEILTFGSAFREYIFMSYLVGLLPALCFGALFSISAVALGRNSLLAATAASLLASLASPVMIGHIARNGLRIASVREFAATVLLFAIAPSLVAAIVCWCITRPLHRRS
jgi:hypothetical protein